MTSIAADTPAVHARQKRVLFLALTGAMYGLVLAGFWPYWRTAGVATPPRPWIIHLHAAVFTGWLALLLAQVLLVRQGQVQWHRRLGEVGKYYGVAVLVMGLVATAVAPAVHVLRQDWTLDAAADFLLFPLGDMVLFGTLFGAAMIYRRKPEIHKRCILLATVALMFAPVARLASGAGIGVLLAVWLSPVAVAMAADYRARRRVHPALLLGTAWLLIGLSRLALTGTPAWLRIGRWIVAQVTPLVAGLI